MKTSKQKETNINAMLKEAHSDEELFNKFIYLTSKRRSARVSENELRKTIKKGKLGDLLKRLDPIAWGLID